MTQTDTRPSLNGRNKTAEQAFGSPQHDAQRTVRVRRYHSARPNVQSMRVTVNLPPAPQQPVSREEFRQPGQGMFITRRFGLIAGLIGLLILALSTALAVALTRQFTLPTVPQEVVYNTSYPVYNSTYPTDYIYNTYNTFWKADAAGEIVPTSMGDSAPIDNGSTIEGMTDEVVLASTTPALADMWLKESTEGTVQAMRALRFAPGTDAERAADAVEQALTLQESDPFGAIIQAAHARLTAEAAQVIAGS